ncbi:MAG: carboxypeptidase regulatory-like domain-containing protein [candidate division Zixibacteria bacterium]
MKIAILVVAAVMLGMAPVYAQGTGTVSGIVYDHDDNPVADAYIHLTEEGWHGGGGHGHHHHGENYFAETDTDGTFIIENVLEGTYTAIASKMGFGHDSEEIDVTPGQNTEVEFNLEFGGHGGGGMHGDSLEIIEISGWAIVEEDSLMTHYYLDTENDQQADYHLMFGPPWYDPDSGAERPAQGDSIWIVGGVMGYSQPQPVVVYEINGLFWREPGDGHGGHGGFGGDCPHPDSVDLVEVNGTAIVEGMPHMDMYFLDEDSDQEEDYILNFGAPWYDPGNGATRPDDGDMVDIVGGLMEGCMDLPMIIVYEINGEFWREPGDTTGLWLTPTYVEDKSLSLPAEFITVNAYPNPFNPAATISFDLQRSQHVRVSVYDILGREIDVIADGFYPAGNNDVFFAPDESDILGSSIFFYKVAGENSRATGKMVFLK